MTMTMKCKHQFFETNKEFGYHQMETADQNFENNPILIQLNVLPEKYGVRVVCVFCKEKRIVWQDGQIDIYLPKKNLWKKL